MTLGMLVEWSLILACSENRGFLTSIDKPIKNGPHVADFLSALLPPSQIAITKTEAQTHQSHPEYQGNVMINFHAKAANARNS